MENYTFLVMNALAAVPMNTIDTTNPASKQSKLTHRYCRKNSSTIQVDIVLEARCKVPRQMFHHLVNLIIDKLPVPIVVHTD